MKIPLLYFVMTLCIVLFSQNSSFSQGTEEEEEEKRPSFINMKKYTFSEIQKKANRYFSRELKREARRSKKKAAEDSVFYQKFAFEGRPVDNAYHKYKRWEWFWKDRLNPDGSFHDITDHHQAYIEFQRQARPKALSVGRTNAASGTWVNINQTAATGGYNGMGRSTFVAFHPTDFNTYYAGAPIGGIWKAINNQTSYLPLGDSLPYVSTGSIAVNYLNPSVIYISVGDAIGWWNWDLGVYKSKDGGATWKVTSLQWPFTSYQAIRKIVMSPKDTAVLLAATTAGLYKTTNGGNSWTLVNNGFHFDVIFKPNNNNNDGNIIFASTDAGEIYRSYDAGNTWSQIYSSTGNGVRLSVTIADPNTLLASHYTNNTIIYSRNLGSNFTVTTGALAENPDMIFVSQTNPNVFYYGGVDIFKSTDAGNTWTQITHWCCPTGGQTEVHADQHYAAASPINPDMIYFCNDGGVYQYNEATQKWVEKTNGFVTTQYYNISTAQDNNVVITGGSQDNGGRYRQPSSLWTASTGGDAMFQAIDPNNSAIMYSTYVSGQLFLTTNAWGSNVEITPGFSSGSRQVGAWAAPFILDPNNSKVIIAGYQDVWRSANRGATWTQISNNLTGGNDIAQLAAAPGDSNTIYASEGVRLWKTTNKGTTWTQLTVPDATMVTDPWGDGAISGIAISNTNKNNIWISRTGYNAAVKVYKSTNGGASWTNISSGLPNVPVNAIIYENGSSNNIFIGTDAGVFLSSNGSAWKYFGFGLPNTSTTSLVIQYASGKLRAGTFGRGVWEIDLPIALPLNLISFTAAPDQNTRSILLSWTTSGDIDDNYFIVERSTDGSNFYTIGKIDSKGNASSIDNYSFHDLSPSAGINYYRIIEVDVQGKETYSAIVSVNMLTGFSAEVYPVLFNETLDVFVTSSETVARIEMIDARGVVLNISSVPTNIKQSLSYHLPAGMYSMKISAGDQSEIKKLIKE